VPGVVDSILHVDETEIDCDLQMRGARNWTPALRGSRVARPAPLHLFGHIFFVTSLDGVLLTI